MGNSTVEAQKLANEANLQQTRETNETNYWIAQDANALNEKLFNAQNEWNLAQWNRENEYNSPKQQVQRYIEAGINPLWALSGGNPGNSQQLVSADAKPAEVATMQPGHVIPEYDPFLAQHIGNINTAANNLVNGIASFRQLGLQAADVETRRSAQITRSNLDNVTALETRAKTVGQDLANEWSLGTLDTRIHSESQKLNNLYAQERNLNAGSDEAQAKRLEIEENIKLISQRINESIASIRQRDYELNLMEKGIQVNSQNAETNRLNYKLANERFDAEIKKWNNDTLMQYLYKFGRTVTGKMSASVGTEGLGVKGEAGLRETTPADIQKLKACGLEVLQRAADDPSEQNLKNAEEASRIVKLLEKEQARRETLPVDALFNSDNTSIVNPSTSWQ